MYRSIAPPLERELFERALWSSLWLALFCAQQLELPDLQAQLTVALAEATDRRRGVMTTDRRPGHSAERNDQAPDTGVDPYPRR